MASPWTRASAELKRRCVLRLHPAAQAKQVSESRQAISFRLSDVLERLHRILPLLPPKRRQEALKLGKRLQALRNEIEAVHLSAARKLRMT